MGWTTDVISDAHFEWFFARDQCQTTSQGFHHLPCSGSHFLPVYLTGKVFLNKLRSGDGGNGDGTLDHWCNDLLDCLIESSVYNVFDEIVICTPSRRIL